MIISRKTKAYFQIFVLTCWLALYFFLCQQVSQYDFNKDINEYVKSLNIFPENPAKLECQPLENENDIDRNQ